MTKRKWNPADFAALAGLDWADKKHDICLQAADSDRREHSVLQHRVAAINEWAEELKVRFGGRPVGICIELKHGPIVSALKKHPHLVIFPVDPLALANYRKTMRPSGAKDDANDAEMALDFLRRFPDRLSPLQEQSTSMRTMEALVFSRRQFVQDTTRVTNRLTWSLKAYFPQVLQWFREKNTNVFCEFVRRFPSLQDAQAADDETLTAFFKEHNVHRAELIRERIAAIRSETALTDDAAVVESSLMIVRSCVEQLGILIAAVHAFDVRIAALMTVNADSEIFQSLPAAGPTMAPRLTVAFGEDREQFKDAASMQRAAGVAPVTEASGNQHWVHWRWACSTFLRQTFVEWTALTIPRSFWAKAYYQQRRAKGSSHNAAIRALAFKWIRIIHRLWVDRVPYDESKHLLSLQRRNPELLKFAASQPAFS